MIMATQSNSHSQGLDKSLQAAISSLTIEKDTEELIVNTKICITYMTTFTTCEVDREVLQWIMPVLRTSSQKVYEDNLLLSDTAGDDFIIEILRKNLHTATDILIMLKRVLDYLLTNDTININDVPSVTTIPVQVILSTFEHCRNSSEAYKNSFSQELSNIFSITQQLHNMFIKLYESCLILGNDPKNADEITTLNEVLDTICDISNSLSDLNIKSLILNWKGYANIAQKFSSILTENINLRKPILCLKTDILKNLCLVFQNLDCNDININVIKKTGFLTKVALKILDIFWNSVQRITKEVLMLCCIIFSYPTEHHSYGEDLEDITLLVNDNIYEVIQPFVAKLVEENFINSLQVVNQDELLDKHPFGLLNFLNYCLKCVAKTQSSNVNLPDIVQTIFTCTKYCFIELSLLKNIFASIMIDISACVIIHQEYYEEIEIILLKNLLQENVWSALLAMDVWSLILKYSTEQSVMQVLVDLIKKYLELNLGINSHRLEGIYLKSLIQRIFKILPNFFKYQVSQSLGENDWKVIGFDNISLAQKDLMEQIYFLTVEKAQEIGLDDFTLPNFVFIMENLKMLSTVDFDSHNINVKNLVDVIAMLWEFENNDLSNCIFKYFVNNLSKITRRLIKEFSNKQLFMILNRLKTLSCDDSYKLHVLNLVSEVCNKNTNEFGQDGRRIFAVLSNILHTVLAANSNNLMKQSVLEIIENCSKNGKEEIVRDLARSSVNRRKEIEDYLQKHTTSCASDKAYLVLLGNLEYIHNCIQWKAIADRPVYKKIKLEEEFSEKTLKKGREKRIMSSKPIPKTIHEIETTQSVDNVNEALINLKSEVKCLMNVLKTEKMTAKNVSDLKIIANQLLSLL